MIVDDTVIYRKILKDIVNSFNFTEVIATASNGEIALRKIKTNKPDLVLLDVEMPIMDGLTTIKILKKDFPEIGVIMISGVNERQALITMQALSFGAFDFIPKPIGKNFTQNFKDLATNLSPIINLFHTKNIVKSIKKNSQSSDKSSPLRKSIVKKKIEISSPTTKKIKPKVLSVPKPPHKFSILVIGVSTGGPNSLAKFIPLLPKDLNVPILIVQHMPPMFTKSLANHLNNKSILEVFEAKDKQVIKKNQVIIAQGGKHLILSKSNQNQMILEITNTPPVNSCRPSVDVLFESVSKYYKNNVLSVIMTGMGADGTEGVRVLKSSGCYSITQSEESCVVYGMPRAVIEAGLSDEIVKLSDLSKRVTSLIKLGL